MNFVRVILLCNAYVLCDAVNILSTESNIIAGYVPGLSGMPPINEQSCQNAELLNDPTLSNALECARTCHAGDPPKTCYYSFTVERYPVYSGACQVCTPNVTNSICPNCQCVTLDGVERMALTVNRMIPGPSIQACLGDYIVVDVLNNIKENGISIHWHGLYQAGTQYYDGPPFITQCPIGSGNLFRYQFYGNNSGTHFWHSHTGLQKMDGIAGSLIIREPAEQDPNSDLYDYDLSNHIMFLSDWMHEETTSRHPGREHGVVGQLPDAVFINGKGTLINPFGDITPPSLEVFTVDANKRYRFRMITSFCGICPAEITIENHNYTLIATDGLAVKPVKITSIISYPGERFDVVINTNATPGAYWIQLRALGLCELYSIQQLAILQYLGAPAIPATQPPTVNHPLPEGIVLQPMDSNCDDTDPNELCISDLRSAIPNDENVSGEPDERFYVGAGIHHYTPEELWQPNTYNEFSVALTNIRMIDTVNNISFQTPASPLISQFYDTPPYEFCNAEHMPPWNSTIPISCIHIKKFKKDALIEIALLDTFHKPTMQHPFHLHGHSFRVVSMGQPLGSSQDNLPSYDYMSVEYFEQLVANHQIKLNLKNPPGKDTLTMPNNGYAIYRFYANNAGFWLNHCHVIVHQVDGMQLVMQVGELSDLPPVPANFPKCNDFKLAIKTSQISNP